VLGNDDQLQKMNYECGRVKDDGMNFEVKHPQVLKNCPQNITLLQRSCRAHQSLQKEKECSNSYSDGNILRNMACVSNQLLLCLECHATSNYLKIKRNKLM
jgi:hypothetical protein